MINDPSYKTKNNAIVDFADYQIEVRTKNLILFKLKNIMRKMGVAFFGGL